MGLYRRWTQRPRESGRLRYMGMNESCSPWTRVRKLVSRLCDNPVAFTVEELRFKFEVITVPVTLVCAGNRRKEHNVVQQSLGFSWGAAGLSTALFTGVRLADVLDHVKPNRGAKHVIFEGSDSLPNGPYGTRYDCCHSIILRWVMRSSQLLSWARDRRRGMMLAWGMNGLPYMIRDLNVNSAIACPDHEETVQVQYEGTYTLRGYAYAGGGRRITRVEVSINDGDTWELAEIEYPEDSFRSVAFSDSVYGALDLTDSDQCYCWSFWSLTVPLRSLRDSPSICVRAMDESLAAQPRNMYCNATGMMNNWHVVYHAFEIAELIKI
ncbi:hypothetical protein C0989_000489 [Termitomyces sp. Mn162]|nr:hypothetical protein C0989_000489 [Termitomyces sp. Mn162]